MVYTDPESRALNALRSFVRAISAATRSANRTGVSGAQLFALRQIALSPGLSMKQLAGLALSKQSTVSELVARMTKKGLITKTVNETDARQTNLWLTERGKRAVSDSRTTAQEQLIRGLSHLPRETRTQIAEGLEAWLTASGFSDVAPGMFFEGEAK